MQNGSHTTQMAFKVYDFLIFFFIKTKDEYFTYKRKTDANLAEFQRNTSWSIGKVYM